MKRGFIIALLVLVSLQWMSAQIKDIDVKAEVARNGDYMVVDMTLGMEELELQSNRAVLLTPYIINGSDSVALKSVGVYGRQRHFHFLRNGGGNFLSDNSEQTYRYGECPLPVAYQAVVSYQPWMDGAVLKLHRNDYGCCNRIYEHQEGVYGLYEAPYFPELIYIQPLAETQKVRTISGSAYIDFPVSRTEINPEYRNNVVELAKINATIDSVRVDSDVTIDYVSLKGFASPESPYSNNSRLAEGRTEALKNYILSSYDFKPEVIRTDFVPENWEGLRAYVDASSLEHRAEILEIIDSDEAELDKKEWRIKNSYPEEYRYLLDNCYPALRRTDYIIEYTVVSFSDPEEIRSRMEKQPQKLSQNEFYIVAQTCEPGSAEFAKVFDTAVLMFPDDPTANLNAANSDMLIGNMDSAAEHLEKAGEGPEADYARGVYAYLQKDYSTALVHLKTAEEKGIGQSTVLIDKIARLIKQ